MRRRRRTSVQIASGIEPTRKKKSKKVKAVRIDKKVDKGKTTIQETVKPGEKLRRKSKKITAEEVGEKIGKGISAIRRANIAIEKWADSPGLIPAETTEKLKKGKGPVGRTYRGYKRAQKAEGEYAERLEKGTKAHDKKVARMNKLVKML